MKSFSTLTNRLVLVLLMALMSGVIVSCKKDDDKNNNPAPSKTTEEYLVGNGSKKGYEKQNGLGLVETTNLNEITTAKTTLTLQNNDACDADDGIVFKADKTAFEFYGSIPCTPGGTVDKEEAGGTWKLDGKRLIFSYGSGSSATSDTSYVVEINDAFLRVRSVLGTAPGVGSSVIDLTYETR